MMSLPKKAMIGAAVASIAIATPLLSRLEGIDTKPRYDVGGVLTVCRGETNVEMREYTVKECDELLAARIPEYYNAAMAHVDVEIPITMAASITSFTYNVGPSAFGRSTMLRKINSGDLWGACDELDRWVYVSKMWVKGLANRRDAEKRLCTAELPPRAI